MSSARPRVVVLVPPDAGEPPELDGVRAAAEVHVVRDLEGLREAIDGPPVAEVLAVYDFRTDLVRRLGGRAAELPWIHAASAGVDAVLTSHVAAGDTTVTNAQGVFDRPIAEYVVGLLLAFCKDLPTTLDLQRRRRWAHRETRGFAGRRVVVVGAGSIGSEVGRLAGALGAEVRGIASSARSHPIFGQVHRAGELHEHLGWADDVVCCLPLTEATRGVFDAGAFAAMRRGATFVNVGRGAVVDEAALLDALRDGTVGAAGLDVFDTEPLPEAHPFWALDNVVVSPHMSGDELGWQAALTREFAANLERWRSGGELEHVVHGPTTRRDRA